jgi:hypothetical protein
VDAQGRLDGTGLESRRLGRITGSLSCFLAGEYPTYLGRGFLESSECGTVPFHFCVLPWPLRVFYLAPFLLLGSQWTMGTRYQAPCSEAEPLVRRPVLCNHNGCLKSAKVLQAGGGILLPQVMPTFQGALAV